MRRFGGHRSSQADSFPPELHVASCVLRTFPECLSALTQQLATHRNVQVYANDGHAKLVLILEGPSTGALLGQIDALRQIPGVVSIELVYQHAESETAMKEPMPCQ
jgi:nitrate reductase NapD